jgi:hypothetical protein
MEDKRRKSKLEECQLAQMNCNSPTHLVKYTNLSRSCIPASSYCLAQTRGSPCTPLQLPSSSCRLSAARTAIDGDGGSGEVESNNDVGCRTVVYMLHNGGFIRINSIQPHSLLLHSITL